MTLSDLTQISRSRYFNAAYLRNGRRYRHSYNGILIGIYSHPTQVCNFEWPWVTLDDLSKYSMTRSNARYLCDSWAYFKMFKVNINCYYVGNINFPACAASKKKRNESVKRQSSSQNDFNPLKGTLTQQSNEPLYSNTVIGTLTVDGWAVTFGTARRGLGGLGPRPVPSSLYQM